MSSLLDRFRHPEPELDESGLGHFWKFFASEAWPNGVELDLLAQTFRIAGHMYAVSNLAALPTERRVATDDSELSDTDSSAPVDLFSLNVNGYTFEINHGDAPVEASGAAPRHLVSLWRITLHAVVLKVESTVGVNGAPTVEAASLSQLLSSNSGASFFGYAAAHPDMWIE